MTCYAQGLDLIPYPGRKEKGKERKKNRSDCSPGCAALNVQKVAEIDIVNRPHTACVHGAVSREGRNPKIMKACLSLYRHMGARVGSQAARLQVQP